MAKKRGSRRKKKNAGFIILIVFALILAAVYFGIAFYFSGHFFSNTRINGLDCSKKTVEEAKELIEDKIMEYQLTLVERGGKTETLTAQQLDMEYADDNKIEEVMKKQNPFTWIVAFTGNKVYTVSANRTYNKEALEALMDRLECFNPEVLTAPADAFLERGEEGYALIPEVEGNTPDRERVKKAIVQAIEDGKTKLDLEEEDLYLKPAVRSTDEDMINAFAQIQELTRAKVTYDFKDRTYVVAAGEIAGWLVQDEDGNYRIDEKEAGRFVRQMAYETDTYALKRQFKTTLGTTVDLEGGDYGWVINKEKTTEQLLEKVRAGAEETIEPVYLYKGKDRAKNDIGGTYVEISIDEQKMWCYKDYELVVETDVVTGRVSKGWDTPKGGVWAIDAKARNWHLTSEEFGYDTLVSYWMPFNGNVGIHDAKRTKWGGTVYINSGSHGCINTPIENVEKVFNAVEIGTPVIVY